MATELLRTSKDDQPTSKAILALRHANQCALINHLPPELLVKVFKAVTRFSVHDTMHSKKYAYAYTCHHWRAIALVTATLWSTLDLSSPRWGEMMLARSRGAPLVLRMDAGRSLRVPGTYERSQSRYTIEEEVERGIRPAFREISRIRVLELTQEVRTLTHLLSYLCHPAPMLEELVLHARLEVEPSTRDPPDHGVILPSNIFLGLHTKLRKLSFALIGNVWVTPLTSCKLTHLRIMDLPRTTREGLRWSTVFATLETLPELRELELRQALPIDEDFCHPADSHFLPRLKRLVLVDRAPILGTLLSVIIPPPTATLEVSVFDWVSDDSPTDAMRVRLRALFIAFFKFVEKTGSALSQRLDLTAVQGRDDWDAFTLSTNKWTLYVEHGEDIADSWRAFVEATRVQNSWMSRLHSLRLTGDGAGFGATEWQDALSGAYCLEEVCLCGAQAPELLFALSKSQRALHGQLRPTELFPRLSALVLEEVDCASRWSNYHGHKRFADVLLSVLVDANTRGCGLQKILVRRCASVGCLPLGKIREVVESVQWDGLDVSGQI
jgi:hypothetical protein